MTAPDIITLPQDIDERPDRIFAAAFAARWDGEKLVRGAGVSHVWAAIIAEHDRLAAANTPAPGTIALRLRNALETLLGDFDEHPDDFMSDWHEARATVAEHDRIAAATTPAQKIMDGLRDALLATTIAGEIIDLFPPGVVTKDLHSRVIAVIAPHVSAADQAGSDKLEIARRTLNTIARTSLDPDSREQADAALASIEGAGR
jgi:hypothetical protein